MNLLDVRILWTTFFVSIFSISISMGANPQRTAQVVFESFRCFDMNTKYMKYIDCHLLPHSKMKRMESLYMNMSLAQQLTNWTATFDMYLGTRGKRRLIFKIEPDLCKEQETKQKNFMKKIYFDILVKSWNVPPRCPMPKNVDFIMRDFIVDSSMLPKYVPHVNWLSQNKFYTNGEQLFSTTTEGYLGRRK